MAGPQAESAPRRIVRIKVDEGIGLLGPSDATSVLHADPQLPGGPKFHFGRDRDGVVVVAVENPPAKWTGDKLIPWGHVRLVEYGPTESK